jgi:hypothetical protein
MQQLVLAAAALAAAVFLVEVEAWMESGAARMQNARD